MCPRHGSFDGYHVSEIATDAGPQHVVGAGLTLGKAPGQAIEDRLDLLPAGAEASAPKRVTGSWCDHKPLRGRASPWSLVHGLATLWLNGNLPEQLGDDPEQITRLVARHLSIPASPGAPPQRRHNGYPP